LEKQTNNKSYDDLIKSLWIIGILICLVLIINFKSVPVVYVVNDNINISNSLKNIFNTDDVENSLVTMDLAHHEVHEGEHFFLRSYDFVPLNNGLGFLFYLNGSDDMHIIIEVFNKIEANYSLIENPTITNNGTKIDYLNRNRNYNDTDSIIIFKNPTFSGGKYIAKNSFGERRQFGGEARDINELIFKRNTSYVLYVENIGNGINTINYIFDWYINCVH